MNVTVIGAGYVGSVTAACLARLGHDVLVVDSDAFKVEEIAKGRSPVREPGLDELLAEMVAARKLGASLPSDDALLEADIAVICVSTPSLKAGGVDSRPMQRVFAAIGKAVLLRRGPLVVVVRSTIAPQRLRQLAAALPKSAAARVRLVANPEFVRETTAIADFERPPFVLLGGDDAAAVEQAAQLYDGLEAPLYRVDLETALLVKYASNAYHALKIAFANEVAAVARALNADPRRVMSIFAEDRVLNVSAAYLRPGFAFGGSCLPKDVRALVALARGHAESVPLLRAVLESNRVRIDAVADEVEASGARRVAMLGLSFKRGTDDVRESPYVLLAELLVGRGLDVRIFDPDLDPERLVGANRQYLAEHLPGLSQLLAHSLAEALAEADGAIVCKHVATREQMAALTRDVPHVFDLEYLL